MLPATDTQYLDASGLCYSVAMDSGMQCVIFPGFVLPHGFNRPAADLLLRLHPGYPDVPPDMWWFDPTIARADGRVIAATNLIERYLGRSWQRWSRHLRPGQWRSGIDGIENYIAIVRSELNRSVVGLAA